MASDAAIEHFERDYAERSGTTVQELHAWGRFGAVCDCTDDDCPGFQMLHLRDAMIDAGWTPPEESHYEPHQLGGMELTPDRRLVIEASAVFRPVNAFAVTLTGPDQAQNTGLHSTGQQVVWTV